MILSTEEKSMLIALTIGDGHISPEGRLTLHHSIKQQEYLEYKANILSKIIGGRPIKIHKNKTTLSNGKTYETVTASKTSKYIIGELRDIMYPEGKKVITREILNQLTAEGIAIWYMDDGNIHPCKDKNGKIHSYVLGISTYLTREENQVIIDYFKDKWDLNFRQCEDRGKYRLAMGTREARKFLELVRPYIEPVECMRYKIIEI